MNPFSQQQKKSFKPMLVYLFVIAFFVGLVVFVGSLFIRPKYQATIKFLFSNINEKNQYAENAQNTSKVFSQIVNSKSFIKEVYSQSGTSFNSKELDNRLSSFITAEVVKDSPIIDVVVYHQNKDQLKKISTAVLDVLNNRKFNLGKAQEIKIDQIDPPYVYIEPVAPKPLRNALIAFVVVLIVGSIVVYIYI